MRLLAPPVAFTVAVLLARTEVGASLQRAFMSMFLHELGHATMAWLGGFPALPAPWITLIADERQVLVTLALLGMGSWAVRLGWPGRRWGWMLTGSVVVLLALGLRGLSDSRIQALVSFAGDAGAMVYGMGLVVVGLRLPGDSERLRLARWLALLWGAGSFVDAFGLWLRASRDWAELPLGRIEGVGLSDASKLVQVHGWSVAELTTRYLLVGGACLAGGLVAWGWAVVRAPGSPRPETGGLG